MILKTFWAHRKQNGWLIAEIAFISLFSFFFIDQILMIGYNRYICRADGEFEQDHLLIGSIARVIPDSKNSFNYEYSMADKNIAVLYGLRDYLKAMPEVQSVCFSRDYIGNGGYYNHNDVTVCPEGDTTRTCPVFYQEFMVGGNYFETQGLTPVEGSPKTEELSEECPEDGIVITRSLANSIFGTDQAVGRAIVVKHEDVKPHVIKHYKVAGIVKDVKVDQNERYCYTIFEPEPVDSIMPDVLIRLKPEVDAEEFVAKWNSDDMHTKCDHVVRNLESYKKNVVRYQGITTATILLFFIGTFLCLFLLNVIIGTLGTFWLQIRKRTGDIGIMRSFGAKRRTIFFMIWKEAALLTFIACLIGQFLWMQIAINGGLAEGNISLKSGRETDWITQFWPHFLMVCGAQYLFILFIVTIGIITPSLIAMYKKPVNALRYE